MNKTKIEWVKNPDNKTLGYTLNSKTGCRNHVNGLCKGGGFPCYAYRLANGRLKQRYLANPNTAVKYQPEASIEEYEHQRTDPFYPRWWPERLEQVKKHKAPSGIFLDDMSDWMGDYWPREWTEMEIETMRQCPQHRFYTLTKQPQNLIKFSPFPANCWVGVTATSEKIFENACLWLERIEATVKYISFEPLLEWRNPVVKWDRPIFRDDISTKLKSAGITWCIVGAQTRPTVWPSKYWIGEIIKACSEISVPVFLKDNLSILVFDDYYKSKTLGLANKEGIIRQELPFLHKQGENMAEVGRQLNLSRQTVRKIISEAEE